MLTNSELRNGFWYERSMSCKGRNALVTYFLLWDVYESKKIHYVLRQKQKITKY